MRELGVRCANLASGARTRRQVRELGVPCVVSVVGFDPVKSESIRYRGSCRVRQADRFHKSGTGFENWANKVWNHFVFVEDDVSSAYWYVKSFLKVILDLVSL